MPSLGPRLLSPCLGVQLVLDTANRRFHDRGYGPLGVCAVEDLELFVQPFVPTVLLLPEGLYELDFLGELFPRMEPFQERVRRMRSSLKSPYMATVVPAWDQLHGSLLVVQTHCVTLEIAAVG